MCLWSSAGTLLPLLCHRECVKAAKHTVLQLGWLPVRLMSGTEPHLSTQSVCEWTITKNLPNSCCSPSLPPSASTPSPPFTSRCSDASFRVALSSPSFLIPSCHFVRLNTGASCHSLSPHAGLISHSFPADDGGGFASQINALHLHFLSHFCITLQGQRRCE